MFILPNCPSQMRNFQYSVCYKLISGAGGFRSLRPVILPIPIDFFSFLLVEDFNGTQYQSGSFSSINVGSDISLPA